MTDFDEFAGLSGAAPDDMSPGLGDGPPAPPPDGRQYGDDDPDNIPLYQDCAALPLNDYGNSQRFVRYFGDDAIYVPRVGWHIWDGKRWKLDPDNIAVRRCAQQLHDKISREVAFAPLTEAEKLVERRIDALRSDLRALETGSAGLDAEAATEKAAKLKAELADLTAKLWGKGSTRARHMSHAKSAGNSGQIDHAIAESITALAHDVDELDADPLTVNTQTGILRFRVTGEGKAKTASVVLEPHTRQAMIEGRNQPQYITKMMPADYDPDATCPRFDAFLERVQPDADIRAFLQTWFGLSMTALPVQKFLYCYGMGANGKSLLATLMRRMLGDYATMIKIQSLTGQNRKSGADATPDLMRLIGARAAITSEPEESERLQEQKIKEMTGGEEMLVRALHTDFVEFTPYFKLMFTANHKLDIRGTDDGIWRRTLMVPWDVQIPEAERDRSLGDTLFDTERSGILNWMIAGLVEYLEYGLQEPASVRDATEEYRRDSDPIGDFLTNACEIDGGSDWLSARDLIDACYLYQLENNANAWRPGTLARRLKDRAGKFMHPATSRSYIRHKIGDRGYLGIRLNDAMLRKLRMAPRDGKGLPILSTNDETAN